MMKKLFLGILLMLSAQALFSSPSLAATAVVDVSKLLGWGVPEFSAGDVTYPAAVPFTLLFENNGTVGLNVSGNLSIIKDGSVIYTGSVFQGNVSVYQNRSFAFSWTPSLSGDFLANLTINITSSYDGQSNLTSTLTSFTVYSTPSAAPSGRPPGTYTTPSNASSSAGWDRLLPGVPVWFEIKNALIAFSRVALVAANETRYVKIEINRIYALPRTVSEPPGKTYQYIEIKHENLAGNLKNATIDFRVEKKWMLDNGIEEAGVFLRRYSPDGRWESLATALLKEDSLYAYYRSEIYSLSIFSITGMQKACSPGDRRCNGSYLQACSTDGVWESATQCENGCDENEKACIKTKPACSGEEKRCAGDVLQKCSADGFGWDIVERCKYGCWDNECKEMYVSFITKLAVSVMFLILVAIVAIMAYLVYINLGTFLRKK